MALAKFNFILFVNDELKARFQCINAKVVESQFASLCDHVFTKANLNIEQVRDLIQAHK